MEISVSKNFEKRNVFSKKAFLFSSSFKLAMAYFIFLFDLCILFVLFFQIEGKTN